MIRIGIGILAVIAALAALWQIDRTRGDLRTERVTLAGSPATVYRPVTPRDGAPLVVVAHGFAGSRQMMQALSFTLARAGSVVVAFDFIGHGRHPGLMSPQVETVDGTTAALVDQTFAVAQAARALPGAGAGPLALVGHSMATDVTIRAAQRLPDMAAIVAISMYSDTVTADFPEHLLIVSGAWEQRLRDVGLRFLQQVDPAAAEGDTATAGAVQRRAVAAPNVEHVGVLYSPTTLEEARDWIAIATGGLPVGPVAAGFGPAMLVLLGAVVVAYLPLSMLAGPPCPAPPPPSRRRYLAAIALPVLPAAAAMVLLKDQGTVAGFVPLAAFLGVWGAAQLAVLARGGWRPDRPRLRALALLVAWGLVFALVLDAAFSAFIPMGPRAGLMVLLLLGALPFAVADAALAHGAPLWRRVLARLILLTALAATMIAAPRPLGLIFTVLPVLLLFWLVYGSFARLTAARAGTTTAAIGSALALAWALAASTPLFALP
ncbi:alpha/beta hydrolase [Meridianimarinicoccus sp. RP-17]|uniref:alpha/beta hydrolase n=1 Tax=Meridianimarinicoccus zhengii TaxID=2056810 RepID=UPI000DAF3BEE|nr:alpha/beta fold hydrolase [Phycocomes zhengii]